VANPFVTITGKGSPACAGWSSQACFLVQELDEPLVVVADSAPLPIQVILDSLPLFGVSTNFITPHACTQLTLTLRVPVTGSRLFSPIRESGHQCTERQFLVLDLALDLRTGLDSSRQVSHPHRRIRRVSMLAAWP